MTPGVFTIPLTSGTAKAAEGGSRGTSRSALSGEFIAGEENRLAAFAVKAVFEGSTAGLSPLVLYGAPQCGKTHLARGLADWWQRHHPTALVQVQTGAEYAQAYADAVEADRVAAWRVKLRSSQMLVIDDLEGLAEKRAAQQELRHLLDDLTHRGALVIFTARSLPGSLANFSEGLRSRLSGGLVVPVSTPLPAARVAMIERFAEAREMTLSRQTIQALAESLPGTAPALLGALMELELAARMDGVPLDVERVRLFVNRTDRSKPLKIRDIAATVARYTGVKLADLKSPTRRKVVVHARNLAVFLARQRTDQSLEQIGEYFGGRDHTTILHGYRQIETSAKSDAATKQALDELKLLVARL